MVWRLLALLASVSLFLCLGQEKRKPRPAEFKVVEFKAVRSEDRVLLDGAVRNVGESPAKRMALIIHFLNADKKVISTRNTDLEPDPMEPGDDATFMLETPFPARAVFIRLETFDRSQRWYPLARAGVYTIE